MKSRCIKQVINIKQIYTNEKFKDVIQKFGYGGVSCNTNLASSSAQESNLLFLKMCKKIIPLYLKNDSERISMKMCVTLNFKTLCKKKNAVDAGTIKKYIATI